MPKKKSNASPVTQQHLEELVLKPVIAAMEKACEEVFGNKSPLKEKQHAKKTKTAEGSNMRRKTPARKVQK